MALPTFTEKWYLKVIRDDIQTILNFLDNKLWFILWPLAKRDDFYFYLAWWGAVLLDSHRIGEVYQESKDFDFLWLPDSFHIEHIIERIRNNTERIIVHDEIYWDEEFISMDFHTDAITGDIRNKFLVEFLNMWMLIEAGSTYDIYDLRADFEQYFLNEQLTQFENIRVCNAYITWYNRLVTLRDMFNKSVVWETILKNHYFIKTLSDVQKSINRWYITKEDVRNNIGYLIDKYFANSPQVKEDFETFLWELTE